MIIPKKGVCFFLLLCCSTAFLILGGCGQRQVRQVPQAEESEEAVVDLEDTTTVGDQSTTQKMYTKVPESLNSVREVQVYTLDPASMEISSVTRLVPKEDELTPKTVTGLVLEELGANDIEVGLLSASMDGDSVILDFSAEKPPVADTEEDLETAILDCLSHSLLDNVEGCRKVYLRIEGDVYQSSHISYGLYDSYE